MYLELSAMYLLELHRASRADRRAETRAEPLRQAPARRSSAEPTAQPGSPA